MKNIHPKAYSKFATLSSARDQISEVNGSSETYDDEEVISDLLECQLRRRAEHQILPAPDWDLWI